MGPGVLTAGTTTRLAARFTLPPGTPPSHDMAPAYARMRFRVHISIPWRIDVRRRYDFAVRLPPPPVVERVPLAFRSTPVTAAPGTPRIEVGLASTRLIAGETLVGSLAVFHLGDRSEREVELTLVPTLTLKRGRARTRRGPTIGTTVTLPAGSAGTSIPFQLALPATMLPTFDTVTHALRWQLVARAGSFFGGTVEAAIPLEIVDASAAATTPRLVAAPRLADEQVASLFAAFAAGHGWHAAVPDADEDAHLAGQVAVERRVGDSVLRLAYAYRGAHGTFLVAHLDHPHLGLGLSVTPGSSLRHLFFRDLEIDIAAWDRAHVVVARTAAQTTPVLRAIVPALVRAERLGSLVRWTDDDLVFERAVSAVEPPELAAMGALLEHLALVIAAARPTITPPPGVRVDVPAWAALATWLEGALALGDLSIRGALEGAPVEVGLEWGPDDRATAVRAAVGDPGAATAELRAITLAFPRPAADVLGDPAGDRLVEQVTRWPAEIVDLRVEDGVASASLRLAPGAGPEVDAARVRELVLGLRAVLVALAPATGPYR